MRKTEKKQLTLGKFNVSTLNNLQNIKGGTVSISNTDTDDFTGAKSKPRTQCFSSEIGC